MTNQKIRYEPIAPEIEDLAFQYGKNPESLLEMLSHLQDKHGGLSKAVLRDAARSLGLPAHKAYGMATFYSLLTLDQHEKVIRVCDGPVCKAKGSDETHRAIEAAARYGWRVERSSCLGLCDRAPAVLVEKNRRDPFILKMPPISIRAIAAHQKTTVKHKREKFAS